MFKRPSVFVSCYPQTLPLVDLAAASLSTCVSISQSGSLPEDDLDCSEVKASGISASVGGPGFKFQRSHTSDLKH